MSGDFSRARNDALAAEAVLPLSAQGMWEARGWMYVGDPAGADELTTQIEHEVAEAAEAAARAEARLSGQLGSISQVKTDVGDDPELAAAALESEQGGQNRPTLVKHLQQIIDSAGNGDTEE